jgi:hypothetical protein
MMDLRTDRARPGALGATLFLAAVLSGCTAPVDEGGVAEGSGQVGAGGGSCDEYFDQDVAKSKAASPESARSEAERMVEEHDDGRTGINCWAKGVASHGSDWRVTLCCVYPVLDDGGDF